MKRSFRNIVPGAGIALAAVLALNFAAAGPAHAQAEESLSFLVSATDDGSCPEIPIVASGDYSRTGGHLEAYASVAVGPHGGDCRVQATSFSFDVERSVDLSGGWQGLGKFTADRRAASALYEKLGGPGGPVIARPGDGAAAHATALPIGDAETLAAIVGLSRDIGIGEIDFGVNVVPVDWANPAWDSSQTLHVSLTGGAGPFGYAIGADFGRDAFGDVRLTWTQGRATCKAEYAFGITAVAGIPDELLERSWTGDYWRAAGAQDTRSYLGCGVSFGLGG